MPHSRWTDEGGPVTMSIREPAGAPGETSRDPVSGDSRTPGEWTSRRGEQCAAAYSSANLTHQEGLVLELLAEGLTTAAIAGRLFLSRQAVTWHIGNLIQKLGVANRTGLVSRAFSIGLLEAGSWPPPLHGHQD